MSAPIDERSFDADADLALHALETALNELEGLEVDLESGILTIEFGDGQRFVINSHRAARQIWMAAASQAWHFDVDAKTKRWTAAKGGEELWSCLEAQISRKLGRPVVLARTV